MRPLPSASYPPLSGSATGKGVFLSAASLKADGRPSGLRMYASAARLGFRRQFAYPAATFWGLVTNLFFGALRVAILLALFGTRPQVAGYTPEDAIAYTGLTQALLSAFSLFGWYDLMRTVHRGEVTTELLRPASFLGMWLAQDAGRAAGQFLLRGVSMLTLYALMWGLKLPEGLVGWACTALSLLLAWACGFAFRFLVNCAALWSPDAVGIGRFAWALMGFSCGFLMPLAFFPVEFQSLLAWTPFPAMMNSTVEIWLGVARGGSALRVLALQAVWTAALLLLARLALSRGLRRLEVGGG
ncbi:ABC-2 type transport system permease protein [Deinococcus hopiensis KR-140]|uniref:ABC-2 type transport system permease protein n=1 Tax=Deinococcus hopiensis KR-140 TaxID=695939 RepID=A0A1W1VLH5_9DEIO|nr:ABC-2 type transport system permease protein [Deinococcus hopiensis KR-140]